MHCLLFLFIELSWEKYLPTYIHECIISYQPKKCLLYVLQTQTAGYSAWIRCCEFFNFFFIFLIQYFYLNQPVEMEREEILDMQKGSITFSSSISLMISKYIRKRKRLSTHASMSKMKMGISAKKINIPTSIQDVKSIQMDIIHIVIYSYRPNSIKYAKIFPGIPIIQQVAKQIKLLLCRPWALRN